MVGVPRTNHRRRRQSVRRKGNVKTKEDDNSLVAKWAKRFALAALVGGGGVLGKRYAAKNLPLLDARINDAVANTRSLGDVVSGRGKRAAREVANNFRRRFGADLTEMPEAPLHYSISEPPLAYSVAA